MNIITQLDFMLESLIFCPFSTVYVNILSFIEQSTERFELIDMCHDVKACNKPS